MRLFLYAERRCDIDHDDDSEAVADVPLVACGSLIMRCWKRMMTSPDRLALGQNHRREGL